MTTTVKVNLTLIFILLLLFTVIAVVDYLTAILAMLGGVVLVAYVLLGPVNLLEDGLEWGSATLLRRPRPGKYRVWAIILVYLLFLGLVAVSAIQGFPRLSAQVRGFAEDLPAYLDQVQDHIKTMPRANLLEQFWPARPAAAGPAQNQTTPPENGNETDTTVLQNYSTALLGHLVNLGTMTLATLIYLLIGLVLTFYMLLDGKRLKEGFVRLLPKRLKASVDDYLATIHRVLYNFIRVQVVMGMTGGLYLYIVFQIFQVKYAFFLAFVFGAASIVPVLGPLFGILPAALVVLFSTQPIAIIPILICAAVFYMLKVYWILPKLVQYDFDIHPVIIILSFLVCVHTADMAGVLLAFPLASLISGTYEYLLLSQSRQGEV
jgi:predicted PurR-regulated permease PerM